MYGTCKVKVPAERPLTAHQFSRSSPGAAVLRAALKQLEGRSVYVKLPPIDFIFYFFARHFAPTCQRNLGRGHSHPGSSTSSQSGAHSEKPTLALLF